MPAQPSPSRMEAFSDGVIAVIITIMVLEFKVPRDAGLAGLVTILPALVVYALSFSFTGVYWINHHLIVARLRHVDGFVLWANLALLFSLSLLPFFTSYLIEKHLDSFSVAVYAASLLATGAAFTLLGAAIERHVCRYQRPAGSPRVIDKEAQPVKSAVSLLLYFLAIPMAFWHPRLALTQVAFVTVLWIVPNFRIQTPPAS